MKFIKTTERLPEKENTYHVQWLDPETGQPTILASCEFDGKEFIVDEDDDILLDTEHGAQPDEWLDVNAKDGYTYGELFSAVNHFYGSDFPLQHSQLDNYLNPKS